MKHQSMFDTLMLPPLLGDPALAVIIKRELQFVPFYTAGTQPAPARIFIDRKGGASVRCAGWSPRPNGQSPPADRL